LIAYLTLGEKYSGIFSGQVVDVCYLLSEQTGENVALICFVSLRNFKKEKIKIKNAYQNSIVLPLFPKLKNWRFNIILLFLVTKFKKYDTLICRNSIPATLGLKLKKRAIIKNVILDGRGAEYEQYIEYNILSNYKLEKKLRQVESDAVKNVDFRIAVSEKLVEYWKNTFNYYKNDHIIIPCSLNRIHENLESKKIHRKDFGFKNSDVVLVYCGSISGWQSFKKMFKFIKSQILQNKDIKVLLLTKELDEVKILVSEFPDRVICTWCSEKDVLPIIELGDYGLIIRDNTITNEVACPVKFAEYLYAGLKVIISEKIGDCNSFLLENNCGISANKINRSLNRPTIDEKTFFKSLALKKFSKNHEIINSKYKLLLKKIRKNA
tara:strand:- start:2386 stop:3525 length:1140 start_codon:yes stop_codon:yes gene_type:complete